MLTMFKHRKGSARSALEGCKEKVKKEGKIIEKFTR
jgi:hypothetical protein